MRVEDFEFSVENSQIRKGRTMQWSEAQDPATYCLDASIEAIRAYEQDILDSWMAKRNRIPVCWAPAWGPFQLIARAFGFGFVGISGLTEWLARYGLVGYFVDRAEMRRLGRDVCNLYTPSFALLADKNSLSTLRLPFKIGFPTPDLIVIANQLCDDEMKVIQNMAHEFKCPSFLVDVPFNISGHTEDKIEEEIVHYYAKQLEGLIRNIAKRFNQKFDEQIFSNLIKTSNEMIVHVKRITELRKNVPSPMSHLDAQECVIRVMLNLLGTKKGLKVIRSAYEEMCSKAKGTGCIPKERMRLMWNGLTPYADIGLLSYWYDRGVIFALDSDSVGLRFHVGYQMDLEKPLESLARRFLSIATNSDKQMVVRDWRNLIEEYNIDGIVHSSNYGCRPVSIGLMDEIQAIAEACQGCSLFNNYGIPQIVIDQDVLNEQFFDTSKIKNLIQTLIEVVELRKGYSTFPTD